VTCDKSVVFSGYSGFIKVYIPIPISCRNIFRLCSKCQKYFYVTHSQKNYWHFWLLYLYTFSIYENASLIIFSAESEYISTRYWYRNINFYKTRVPGENHRLVASLWQTLPYNVVSSTPVHELDTNRQVGGFLRVLWFYKSLYSDTNILSKYIPSLQKKL
jgi:hypothetical protein